MKKLLTVIIVSIMSSLPMITYGESVYNIQHKDHVRQDYEIHIDFPDFDGLDNKKLEEEVNREIRDKLDKTIKEVKKVGGDSIGFPVLYYEESLVIEDDEIYSVVMTSNITRGNQYQTSVKSINFENHQNGVFLDLKDVAHMDKLNQEVRKKLSSEPDTFDAQSFSGIREDTAFYISGGKITLVFNKYEIASGVYGTPEISIPYDLVKKEKPQHKKSVPVPKVV
ncbi:DUF3298 and DUF4163 domain-containing protein [Halobacillus seohaensis]|uniref:DUF3298 domain-containing protein n=1 Tax=Halobacillus seohaensis TaxID=447421 RepID=A0ABW2ERE8_9BACI